MPFGTQRGSAFSAPANRARFETISGNETSGERSRRFRAQATEVERKLWARLRAQRFDGFKFCRQHPIGPYFADFCCTRQRLVIQLDSDQHGEAEVEEKTSYAPRVSENCHSERSLRREESQRFYAYRSVVAHSQRWPQSAPGMLDAKQRSVCPRRWDSSLCSE